MTNKLLLEGLSDAVGFVGGALAGYWPATCWAGTSLPRATATPASAPSCWSDWAADWACRGAPLAAAAARTRKADMTPTLVTSCTALPPEGAIVALGRPGGD